MEYRILNARFSLLHRRKRFSGSSSSLPSWHAGSASSTHSIPARGGIFRVEVSAGNFARGTYTEVIRHRRIAFTWGWEGRTDLPPGHSLVEIELVPEDSGTLLRLRHSGLPKTAEAPFAPEDHGKRWANYLERLKQQNTVPIEQVRRTS